MIDFEGITYYLILLGLPVAGFLLGAVWGYLQSVRNEEGTIEMVLTALGVGVLCGYICFYFARMLVFHFENTFLRRP
jgi:hypothetical protein